MLQKYNGPKLVSDILNPPFLAEQFQAVLLLNIIDSCRDPFLLLQQADALLSPGGKLIISCPFSYLDHVTPMEKQISADFLQHFLTHRDYHITIESHEWWLKPNKRTTVTHDCLTLEAQKPHCR